jgi:hypothetical protein
MSFAAPRTNFDCTNDCSDNLVDASARYFVLPDSNHSPTAFAQRRCFSPVTLSIISDLLVPPRTVHLGRVEVLGTTVPVAAIDKDTQARTAENNVGFALHSGIHVRVLPESQSESV